MNEKGFMFNQTDPLSNEEGHETRENDCGRREIELSIDCMCTHTYISFTSLGNIKWIYCCFSWELPFPN